MNEWIAASNRKQNNISLCHHRFLVILLLGITSKALDLLPYHTQSCPGPQFQLVSLLCCLLPNSSKPLSLFNISSSPRPNPGTYCTNPIPWTKCNCERCMGVKVAEKQSLEGVGEAWTPFMRRDPIRTGWVGTLSQSFLLCPREDMLWLKKKC